MQTTVVARISATWVVAAMVSLAPQYGMAVTEASLSQVEGVAAGEKVLPRTEQRPADIRPRIIPGEASPTMADLANTTDVVVTTPEEALEALKVGNARFFSHEAVRPEYGANARRAQIMTQTPFAVVLGCSDSRVPIEIVYDQGLGDIFSIRVAGNISDRATLGSIEYAVDHLQTKIVVVMGHEGCGAIAAAMLPAEQQKKEAENVQYLLSQVRPSLQGMPPIRDRKARMREAVIANIRWQVAELKKNPTISAAIERKQIILVGAFYEISSGAVDFLETEEELRVEVSGQ